MNTLAFPLIGEPGALESEMSGTKPQ